MKWFCSNRTSNTAATGGNSGAAAPSGSSVSGSARASATGTTAAPRATTGTSGSVVLFSDGSEHTYTNPYGGSWAQDDANPWLDSARPNSWTPALSEPWDYATQKIKGVNLGGWFVSVYHDFAVDLAEHFVQPQVTEPFIVPGLYERFSNGTGGTAIDEYTLSLNMGDQLEAVMEEHYKTFITEQDFMDIAAAGLNWIRLPIGFWAIETWSGEPFLAKVSWTYILQALQWARKYGLRVNLDLHAVPGSQNGWNHSGRLGQINWLRGVMGVANAERSLNYIRYLAEFISQPEYTNLVQMFGIINEPRGSEIGQSNIGSFYREAHDMIRDITGYGVGNGAWLSVHEAFLGPTAWQGFLQGSNSGPDRMSLDLHQYTVSEHRLQAPKTLAEHRHYLASSASPTRTRDPCLRCRTFPANGSPARTTRLPTTGVWCRTANSPARSTTAATGSMVSARASVTTAPLTAMRTRRWARATTGTTRLDGTLPRSPASATP